MRGILIFVALLLVVFMGVVASAKDCTNCPNNEQCMVPPSPTKIIAKGGVLDDNILKMVPDKIGVIITCENGEKYIAKKRGGDWTLECTNGQCYQKSGVIPFRLIPRVKKEEPQPTLLPPKNETGEKRLQWRNKCGRRGWFRFWSRVKMWRTR
jgi:hypothetical protein